MLTKIAKNTFLLSSSQIATFLFGFLYLGFLSRSLGVVNLGLYSFTMTFVYSFIPVADFGLERLVLRDISRAGEKTADYFARLLPLRVVLSLVAYLIMLVLALILGQTTRQLLYLAIFGLSLLPYNLIFLLTNFQNAKEEMKYASFANAAITLGTAIFATTFVLLKVGLLFIFAAYPLANIIVLVFLIFAFKKENYSFKLKLDLGFCRKALGKSWLFAFLVITAVFYLRLSVVLTNLLLGPLATGYYGSAFKLVESLILLPQALTIALFPLSSKLIENDKSALKKLYLKALVFVFLASLPFFLVFTFFPNLLVNIVFGAEYLPAVPIYRVLGFSIILFFVNSLAGIVIQNSSKLKYYLPFAVGNFLVMALLCFLLIPRFNIFGSAVAVVGAEFFGFIVNHYFVYRILNA